MTSFKWLSSFKIGARTGCLGLRRVPRSTAESFNDFSIKRDVSLQTGMVGCNDLGSKVDVCGCAATLGGKPGCRGTAMMVKQAF